MPKIWNKTWTPNSSDEVEIRVIQVNIEIRVIQMNIKRRIIKMNWIWRI